MRVNIFGRGICPVLGGLLPKRNVEVSAVQLESILGPKIKVMDLKTGSWITKTNLKKIVEENFVSEYARTEKVNTVPEEDTKVKPKKTRKQTKPVEEVSAIVETVEPVVFEEEKVEVIDEPMEELTAETETEVTLEAETEESTDTESSEVSDVNETNHYHGKKNKKRNK